MTTRYNIPLSSLPEEFFVEELQYKKIDELEAIINNPPAKQEGATIPFFYKDRYLTDELEEQIKAYAQKKALLRAIELRAKMDAYLCDEE